MLSEKYSCQRKITFPPLQKLALHFLVTMLMFSACVVLIGEVKNKLARGKQLKFNIFASSCMCGSMNMTIWTKILFPFRAAGAYLLQLYLIVQNQACCSAEFNYTGVFQSYM